MTRHEFTISHQLLQHILSLYNKNCYNFKEDRAERFIPQQYLHTIVEYISISTSCVLLLLEELLEALKKSFRAVVQRSLACNILKVFFLWSSRFYFAYKYLGKPVNIQCSENAKPIN